MNPSDEISEQQLRQHERDLSRLDWYDTSMSQSFETCEAAMPGFLLAIFAMFLVMYGLTVYLTWTSEPMMIAFPLLAAPFILVIAISCLYLAKSVVTVANASSGFAMQARTQIALTGGLASFICLSPILAGNAPASVLIAYFGVGVSIGHLFTVSRASRPATWRIWANHLQVEKRTRRPQLRLKHVFYLTAYCAALSSLAAISIEVATGIGIFIAVEAAVLLLDTAWVRRQSSDASLNHAANA